MATSDSDYVFRGSTYKLVYGSESRETGLLRCARGTQCQNIQECTSLNTKRTRNCLANSGILVTTSMLCVLMCELNMSKMAVCESELLRPGLGPASRVPTSRCKMPDGVMYRG
jgi:hypothetical protein